MVLLLCSESPLRAKVIISVSTYSDQDDLYRPNGVFLVSDLGDEGQNPHLSEGLNRVSLSKAS